MRRHFFTALLLCCAASCLADDTVRTDGEGPSGVVQNVPTRRDFKIASFTFTTKRRIGPLRIQVSMKDLENNTKYCGTGDVLNGVRRNNFYGFDQLCYNEDVLTHTKRSTLVTKLIPAAVKMQAERLAMGQVTRALKIPLFNDTQCSMFTVPAEHNTFGVKDADYVLYVAAGPYTSFGRPCAFLNDKRPFAGVMNVAPRYIEPNRRSLRLVLHEMTHALGFHWDLLVQLGLGKEKAGKKYINASAIYTIKAAKKHYGCTSLTEIPLEDETHDGEPHWERRLAKEELMSAKMDDTAAYSLLTLALFHDMGFFTPAVEKAERMNWGSNGTCELFTMTSPTEAPQKFPGMFCASHHSRTQCTSNRLAAGRCSDNFHTNGLFFVMPEEGLYCVDTSFGARMGNKRCVERNSTSSGDFVMPMCVEMSCNAKKRSVNVRRTPIEQYQLCLAGQTVQLPGGESIVCPKYDEVCPLIVTDIGCMREIDVKNASTSGVDVARR